MIVRMKPGDVPLQAWKEVFLTSGITFVNLQYDDCAIELAALERDWGVRVHQWAGENLKDDLESVVGRLGAAVIVAAIGFSCQGGMTEILRAVNRREAAAWIVRLALCAIIAALALLLPELRILGGDLLTSLVFLTPAPAVMGLMAGHWWTVVREHILPGWPALGYGGLLLAIYGVQTIGLLRYARRGWELHGNAHVQPEGSGH